MKVKKVIGLIGIVGLTTYYLTVNNKNENEIKNKKNLTVNQVMSTNTVEKNDKLKKTGVGKKKIKMARKSSKLLTKKEKEKQYLTVLEKEENVEKYEKNPKEFYPLEEDIIENIKIQMEEDDSVAVKIESEASQDIVNKIDFKESENKVKLENDEKKIENLMSENRPLLNENKEIKFIINEIEVKNLKFLKKKVNKIKKNYENKELSIEEINKFVADVSNLYLREGYISTRVMLSVPQNLKSGKLKVEIINGIIEKFKYNDNSLRDNLATYTAFPLTKGNILNLKSIESGLEIMNKVSSNNVKMKIQPGTNLGLSIVELNNEIINRFRGNLLYDNLGEENTGKKRIKASFSLDNPLGINDQLGLNYTNSISDDTKKRYSKDASINYQFPIGRWDLSTTQQLSKYSIPVTGNKRSYMSKGNTYQQNYSVSREIDLFRSVNESIKATIELKDVENYIQELMLPQSSYEKSDVTYEYDISKNFKNAGLNVGLIYSEDSSIGKYKDKNKEFKLYKINTDLSKVHKNEKYAIIYTLNAQSQFTDKSVYGIKQMTFGDNVTLRGHDENSYLADRGLILTNNLTYRPITQNKVFQGLQLFTGVDYGLANNVEEKKFQKLGGVSAGAKLSYSHFGANFTWSKAIVKPEEYKDLEYKNEFYTEVYVKF